MEFKIRSFQEYQSLSDKERKVYLSKLAGRIEGICTPAREKGEFSGEYAVVTRMLSDADVSETVRELRDIANFLFREATIYKPNKTSKPPCHEAP